MYAAARYMTVNIKRLSQKYCQPELVEGDQFDCQYFDKLNMTIKLTFETVSFIFLMSRNQRLPGQWPTRYCSFILLASMAGNKPTMAITTKDKRKPPASAIKPINGGPIKKPRNEMDETAASARPGFMLPDLPARL